jgi:nucleoside-diphosphate-sugar epimerase
LKTVTVTGAGGFIGSHVTEALLRLGFRVRLPVRRRTPLVRDLERLGAAIFETGPRNDLRGLEEAIRGAEAVVHCAAAVRASSPRDFHRDNVELTRTVLDLTKREQFFLLLGSQAAAGPSPGGVAVDEGHPPAPVNDYGRSKLRAEETARDWERQRGGRCVVLRPSAVYGPRDRDFLALFKAVSRGVVLLPGDGRQRISLLHVDDLVRAVLTVLQQPRTGTYFVCGEESPSWLELASLIQRVLERDRIRLLKCPPALAGWASFGADALAWALGRRPFLLCRDKVPEMRQPAWVCSSEAFRRDTGWRPAVPLEQGLRRTADGYRAEGAL